MQNTTRQIHVSVTPRRRRIYRHIYQWHMANSYSLCFYSLRRCDRRLRIGKSLNPRTEDEWTSSVEERDCEGHKAIIIIAFGRRRRIPSRRLTRNKWVYGVVWRCQEGAMRRQVVKSGGRRAIVTAVVPDDRGWRPTAFAVQSFRLAWGANCHREPFWAGRVDLNLHDRTERRQSSMHSMAVYNRRVAITLQRMHDRYRVAAILAMFVFVQI